MAGDGLRNVGTTGERFLCRSQRRRRNPVRAGHSIDFAKTSTIERGKATSTIESVLVKELKNP